MYSAFDEVNLYVYHSLRSAFYDVVIWCLGPVVDDTRDYGWLRCGLAVVTRDLCRTWIACRTPR